MASERRRFVIAVEGVFESWRVNSVDGGGGVDRGGKESVVCMRGVFLEWPFLKKRAIWETLKYGIRCMTLDSMTGSRACRRHVTDASKQREDQSSGQVKLEYGMSAEKENISKIPSLTQNTPAIQSTRQILRSLLAPTQSISKFDRP
jgi:hypothetical protein